MLSMAPVIKIAGGRVTQIISLADHTDRNEYMLEPELLTNLFDSKREKRRIVHFNAQEFLIALSEGKITLDSIPELPVPRRRTTRRAVRAK